MATPFIIKQGSKNDLPATYESGALYFCTDTKEIYMDTTNTAAGRIHITNQELETKVTNLIEDLAELTETVTSENQTIKTSISELNSETIKTINVQSNTIALTGNEVTIPAASTTAYGVTKLSSATNSTSTSLAATPSAVRSAYNLANTANTAATNAQSAADTVSTAVANITPITAQNKTPSWTLQSTPTYTDFPYRGSISISGVTANMIPEVTFSPTEALSGNYAPIAQTYAGGVYIYSKVNTSITVPTIICHPKGTSA